MSVVDETTPTTAFSIDDLHAGQSVSQLVRFDTAMMESFVRLSGDNAPFHISSADALAAGFDGPIVHGMHLATRFSRLLGLYLPGGATVIQKVNFDFLAPVYLDDEVVFLVTVERIIPAVNCVMLELTATRGDIRVISGRAQCIYRAKAVKG